MSANPEGMDDLLNTAPCGFLSFTDEGTIVTANETLGGLLGYAAGELAGKKVEMLLTVANRIFYQTHFFPLVKLHGKAEEIFLMLRTRGGGEVPVLTNAVRREQPGGAINHCVFLPVRQRRQYEEEILHAKRAAEDALRSNEALDRARQELELHAQELDRKIQRLEQKNQELSRVGGVLAHDLSEPLRKVNLFADLLIREHEEVLTDRGRIAAEKLTAACARLGALVTTLRQFILVDASDEALRAVDLNEVLRWACAKVTEKAKPPDFRLESDTLPVLEAYPKQLDLLFYHLIDNAVKFRKPDGGLHLRIESYILQHNTFQAIAGRYRYTDFARITVSDNGIGFHEKYTAYVFDILTKLNRESPGLGFGLAICKKIVENHYGSIAVQSTPGVGTSFTILLPVKQSGKG